MLRTAPLARFLLFWPKPHAGPIFRLWLLAIVRKQKSSFRLMSRSGPSSHSRSMKRQLLCFWGSLFLLTSSCVLPAEPGGEEDGSPSEDPNGSGDGPAIFGTGGGAPLVPGVDGGTATVGGTSAGGEVGVIGTGGAASNEPVVWLFQHCPFDGWEVALTVGDYSAADLIALGAMDNDASSLQVTPGYEIILFDGDNQTGAQVTLSEDSSCVTSEMFNDLTTSVRVQVASGDGGSGGAASGGAGSGGASSGGSSSGGSGSGGSDGGDVCRLYYDGDVPVCCTPQGENRTNVDEVLNLLNAYRNSLGLGSVAVSKPLEEAMQGFCMHMDQANFFSHSSPVAALESPWARAEYCGGSADAENIAKGQNSPSSVMTSWKNSSGHDSNMRGNHTLVGIGEYNRVWGQIFK